MPKQILEINPFHGGLNNNGDPRDIKVEELSQAQDIMVDEIGKVRTMGSHVAHVSSSKSVTITEGHGLFYFSHDRRGAQDAPAAGNATGDDYLALADSGGDANIEIYSSEDGASGSWGSAARIDLGTDSGMKAVYYYADGNLRVGDGAFNANNRVQWYGYIDRYFYGDGTSGFDAHTASQGVAVDKWYTGNANLEPLSLGTFASSSGGGGDFDETNPVGVYINGTPNAGLDVTGGAVCSSDVSVIKISLDITNPGGGGVLTEDNASGTVDVGLDKFCTIGDVILIKDATDSGNNNTYFTVQSVTGSVITVNESVTARTNDVVAIYNLSKSGWWKDSQHTQFEIAMSTLYDDSKQESPLYVVAVKNIDLFGIVSNTANVADGFDNLSFDVFVYTGLDAAGGGSDAGDGLHLSYPRVSGFKIYMRYKETTTWYLQSVVDITKGSKSFGGGDYTMWANDEHATHTSAFNKGAYSVGENLTSLRQIETYESETGFDQSNTNIGFNANGLGYKTAVVANRRAYVGNVSIKDESGIVHAKPDAILKSRVNSFDAFSIRDIIEATVNDGSDIVKLEEYADRLLEFKKDKMTLINISQSIEFIEDTFMHKGVVAPSATCKTDYGIAWVNENGCYLYDGQRVNDLLEKGGMQIIKESEWRSFIGTTPMIGYIPKKRQIMVATSAGTGADNGDIYLYDLVTKSWVQGDSKLTDNVRQTNFVTDWNGDLVHAHTSGTVVKWDDTSAATSSLLFATKDMTFGQPGQRKKLHKVYITYKGDASSLVVKYAIDGETASGSYKQFNNGTSDTDTPLANLSSATDWTLAELKPATSSDANNLYSAKFHLSGTAGAGFEINDINVVFRMKNIK